MIHTPVKYGLIFKTLTLAQSTDNLHKEWYNWLNVCVMAKGGHFEQRM